MTQGHDVDILEVMALLRDALATSGMSQAAFARALGTSASRFSTYLAGATQPSGRFCMRAQRLANSLSAASDLGLMSAPVTAAALRKHLRAGDHEWAWRMLLQGRDHLRLMLERQNAALIGSWEAAPGHSGATEFDALLAALTKHEFETADLAAPAWTQIAPLREPWVPAHSFLSDKRVMAKTPDWLRELNIFIPERDLVTA